MQHKKIAKRFRFEKDGITKNATFSGPVVLLQDGLFLVAKSVRTQSAGTAMALFGLLGALFVSLFSSLSKINFPYPAITCAELPDQLRDIKGFGKLKEKHRIIVLRREEILGYKSSLFGGFKLICTGENIFLLDSKKKLISGFLEHGYVEYKPEV